jgi:hypothetical protein
MRIQRQADVLKNSCKATRLNYASHDRKTEVSTFLQEGWLTKIKGFKVSLAGLFQHICLLYQKQLLQCLG